MNRQFVIALGLLLGFALAVPALGAPHIRLVQGYTFDPLVEKPDLPAALTVESYDGAQGYYIVQFSGPVKPEWKEAAARLGAEFFAYLPDYAFICRLPNDAVSAVSALPAVRWVGLYQPAWKLARGLDKAAGRQTLIAVFFKGEDASALLDRLAGLGASALLPEFNAWNNSVRFEIDAARIADVVKIPGVSWLEPYGEITPDNQNIQWVDQRGYSATETTRVIWHKGIVGDGMLIGLTDLAMWTGHNAVRDTPVNTPGPTHRKIAAYRGTIGAEDHGTHTSGTIAGDDEYVGGTSENDGLAKHARLFFQNYQSLPTDWDMNTWFRGPDSGLNVLVESLRALNHSMSLSRKDTYNTYVFTDMTTDQFIWNHRGFMHCNSMGNFGTNQMGHPVNAKSIIATGGTLNGTSCRTFYTTSSRGPTLDGRRKPALVSPAENIYSNATSGPADYVAMSGTSMATPNMTAATALIRQYFRDGFYPTGDTLTGTPLEISAALNKSVAIVGADNDLSGYTVPDNNVGWGRIDLDSSLYFAGDESRLWVLDDTVGLQTGDSAMYTINVAADARPFRVSLCWSDYPGTMQAAMILVNNLDLTVISPTGIEYKGSVYSSGQSVTGGVYDTLNVEECARRNTPELGDWKVKVYARNVPEGPQPFALAAIGAFGLSELHDVGVAGVIAPTGPIDSGTVVTPRALIANMGTFPETFPVWFFIGDDFEDSVSVLVSAGSTDTVDFADWTPATVGAFEARCSTGLVGDENPANDVMADSGVVVPPTAVSEEPKPPLRFALGQAIPNPFDGQTTIGYSLPHAAPMRLAVYSATGELVHTIVSGRQQPGAYRATWDGRAVSGERLAAGIYLLRLEAGPATATRKLVLK